MVLEDIVTGCLVSQDIRKWIQEGKIIVPKFDESKIQPSSFEPTLGEELFILDTESSGLFRPNRSETIYRTLLQLPGRQRKKADIREGFEMKKGFTYLVPLREKIKMSELEHVKSSPKSSFGRLFVDTRMLADFNPCFDEINFKYKTDSNLDLWLLLQPLAFNLVVYPGISFNQMRFFVDDIVQLTPAKIRNEIKENPILYLKNGDNLEEAAHIITDGLHVHLDLSGKNTDGVIGLRARRNPTPIDLSRKNEYSAEEFFEPIIKKNSKIRLNKGEYYLLSSKEILRIPSHLNVELKSHSHIGLSGPLHFAGFVDNGFQGDLVFEIRLDELSDLVLDCLGEMPISKLDLFRTKIPDKLYGTEIGSHYQEQVGPRPSKFFKKFDYKFAAKEYDKLNREVLVQDARILREHREKTEGFELISDIKALWLQNDINSGFFQSRYDCEFDTELLQPIPYVILFSGDKVFAYVRSQNIQDYGDARLFGKHSIGVGGHIVKDDAPGYVHGCISRELNEEVELTGKISQPKFVGTLMCYDKPVDRVHFGLIYKIHLDGGIKPRESSIMSGKNIHIDDLINDDMDKYETWSKVLMPHLVKIYEL